MQSTAQLYESFLTTHLDHLLGMEEPELPPPLTHTTLSLGRKRTRTEYEPTTSSDPPLFSSDDHAPSAETYSSKRRKEQKPGTWWSFKAVPIRRKRSFRRNFDSGIFLGSGETDDSLEEEFLREQRNSSEEQKPPFLVVSTPAEAVDPIEKPKEQSKFDRVTAIIEQCLDLGREDVDLSSMKLDDLPPTIESLKSLTKVATLRNSKTSEKAYHPIEAELRIFLANNNFTRVPNIFQLKNLRVLSLRQNSLTSLPHAISNLEQLQSLNVSANKLTTLPFELLRLLFQYRLEDLIADPNPWTQVPDSATRMTDTGRLTCTRHVMRRAAISNVEILRPSGSVERTVSYSDLQSLGCRQPSLAETALNRMVTLQSFQNVKEWVDEDIPAPVRGILTTGFAYSSLGPRRCLCGQSFILPQMQWVEWWYIDKLMTGCSLKLPFLRQSCSRCVPGAIGSLTESEYPYIWHHDS